MRFVVPVCCAVCVVATVVSAGEARSEPREVWIVVPGERELMRVDVPTRGVVNRDRASVPTDGMARVTRSVNHELRDVAKALRSLDQSYAIRGFQGCGAATAGSVFIDWRAKGLRQPEGTVVLPPAPIVLGIPKCHRCCPRCLAPSFDEETPCDCQPEVDQTPTLLPLAPTVP